MKCPDENMFLRYLGGRLPEPGLAAMDAHLDDCPACRKVFSSLAVLEHTGPTAPLPASAEPLPGEAPHAVTLVSHSPSAAEEPTTINGRYRLLEPLGEGGAGEVFTAEHLGTGRRCAVKFLSDHAAADPDAVERFAREARILGELRHRGIVSILDYAEAEDGRPYLVMDHLEGEDLASRLDRTGPLDWPEVRRLFRQICGALKAAHAQGVLHRDLKPSNIYLTPDDDGTDRAVLLDFGLAKHHTLPEAPLTRTGAVMGTPAYMSPEQARARPVDERTDVYSLAAVLYQMLTGLPPFTGSTFTEVLAQVIADPPPPLATRVTRPTATPLPGHLDPIIQIAMAKDPGQRYGSVAELEHRVLDEAAGAPSLSAPARSQRHRRTWLVLLAGITAAVALGVGVFMLQSPTPAQRPAQATATVTPDAAAPVAQLPDAQSPGRTVVRPPDAALPPPVAPPRIVMGSGRARRIPRRARPRLTDARPRPRARTTADPTARPKVGMKRTDPMVVTMDMSGRIVSKPLSQLSVSQRTVLRMTTLMSRHDFKGCALVGRSSPQYKRVHYYSIFCHYHSGDKARAKALCVKWRKRYPKEWKTCMFLGSKFRTAP